MGITILFIDLIRELMRTVARGSQAEDNNLIKEFDSYFFLESLQISDIHTCVKPQRSHISIPYILFRLLSKNNIQHRIKKETIIKNFSTTNNAGIWVRIGPRNPFVFHTMQPTESIPRIIPKKRRPRVTENVSNLCLLPAQSQ